MPRIVAILWMIFQPLLFGLIGAEVNISQIDGSTVGMLLGFQFLAIQTSLYTTYHVYKEGNLILVPFP